MSARRGGRRRAAALAALGVAAAASGTVASASLSELADRSWWRPRAPVHDPLPGTTGSTAAACGQCHVEIYEEWRGSTHAHAWTDRQFQRELHKDPEVAWTCINCHTPAAGQQAELVDWDPALGVRGVQRRPNPDFDPAWQAEGISCMTCHWRPEGIAAVHEDVQAPHPTVYAPDLQEVGTCTSCHQAAARLEDTLVCHFTTGQEWADELPGRLALAPGEELPTCQSCHMPEVERAVAPGAPVRVTRRHGWPGSLIPKDPVAQADPVGWRGWEPGVEVTVALPDGAPPGQRVEAEIRIENVRAGHRVPTGDPERYLRLHVEVVDGADTAIAGLVARMGQRWLWWPVATKLDDDRIRPGETRRYTVPFVMPADGARLVARLDHYRISPENAAYHDLEGYPTHREVQRVERAVAPLVAGTSPAR